MGGASEQRELMKFELSVACCDWMLNVLTINVAKAFRLTQSGFGIAVNTLV